MAPELKGLPARVFGRQQIPTQDPDARRDPALIPETLFPLPATQFKIPRWEAPKSPRSPLSALASPHSSSRSLKSASSCSDVELESMGGSPPESPLSPNAEPTRSFSRYSSISHPIQEATFAELGFTSGEHCAMNGAQTQAFQQAWGRRAQQHRLPAGAQAVDTSEIRSAAGNRYFVTTHPLKRGSCAEFGLAIDDQGTRYGFRRVHMAACDDAQTAPQKPSDIHQEIWAMKLYAPALEVIDKVRVGSQVYQIMPLMAGSVTELLDVSAKLGDGQISAAFIRDLGVKLCESLQHMHSRGVVHGDLKAGNALWNAQGEVVLSDVAGVLRVDAAGYVECDDPPDYYTARYMAPELTDPLTLSLKYTQAIDVWSLAWLLLESSVGVAESPLNGVSEWHHTFGPHGHLETWREARDRDNPWAAYLGRAQHKDPVLTAFIVDRMLDFDPQTRAKISEVRAFLEGQQRSCGDDPKAAEALYKRAAQRTHARRRQHFASVLARRDAVLGLGS